MKLNRKYGYLLWGIFCLMIVSINMFPVKGDEFVEGNTSVRNAFEIPYLPFQLSIDIEEFEEERWFKLELSKPGSLRLTTNSDLGLNYHIYSEKDLQNDTSPKPLFGSSLDYDDDYYKLDVGSYYIKVYPQDKNGGWKDSEITIEWDLFEDDEYEPNDSYQQATPVQLGEPMTIRFPDSNDVDWFKIEIDKSKALKIKTDASYDLAYAIYTEEELQKGNPIPIKECKYYGYQNEYKYKNCDLDQDYQYWKLDVGVYYIKIYLRHGDYSNDAWQGKDIKITFDTFEDDSYEPNDSYEQATPVQLGEPMTIRLSGENDIDWFKLRVDETVSLNLKSDADYKDGIDYHGSHGTKYLIYPEEELQKANPTPIKEYSSAVYYLEDNQYWKLEAGIYYIKIFPHVLFSIWEGMGEDIQITFDIYQEDSNEPNDSYQQAAPIQLGDPMPIIISGFNDVDWFKVSLDQAVALTLRADRGASYRIYSEEELQKSNPQYLSCPSNYGCTLGPSQSSPHYYNLEIGTYYIVFERYNDSTLGKEINITFDIFEHDQYEPNDSYQLATVINLGETIKIRPTGPKDVDWFKLTLEEPTAWNIKADIRYYLKYDIYTEEEVKKSNPTSLISTSLDSSEDYMKFEAGTYYIKVTSSSADAYRDIILTFDFTSDDAYEYNDTFELATNLSLNEEKFININAPNDMDWFKFSLEEEKVLQLGMASKISKTYQYAIYTTGNLEESVSSGSLSTKNGKTNITLQPGHYYLKVSGSSNHYSTELVSLLLAEEEVNLTRLAVSKYTPTSSQSDVYQNIEITFNKVLLPSSVTKNQFNIKCFNDSIDFDLKYVEGENKVALVPVEPLNYASQYTVFVSRNLKAQDNELSMSSDFSWSFSTQEKRPTESQVGTLAGKVILPNELKGLVTSAKVQLIKDGRVKQTITPTIDGKFSMTSLAIGTYEIRVKLDGFLSDTQTVTISYGDDLEVELNPIVGDLNNDGIIDLYDITIVSSQYNQQSK